MQKPKPDPNFSIDTEPTKAVVVSSLTKDATVDDCIFDLIDNSIDAAREKILLHKKVTVDGLGLPASYAKYAVKMKVGGDGVFFEDNCGGIAIDDLKNRVLRFGYRSQKIKGIGLFGVGLNRAIFKLGKKTLLVTDDGKSRVEVPISHDEYLSKPGWNLTAKKLPSSKRVETKIEITNPPDDISRCLSDFQFKERLRSNISRRYFTFLKKGFEINLDGVKIEPLYVPLRSTGPFKKLTKFYKTNNEVLVFLEAGQHERHRFSAEDDYDQQKNRDKTLTEQFGWTILCNDRTIIMSDTTSKTGWDKKWHSEFNGFVGYVRFVSDKTELLPWNTTKNDVDLTNTAYQAALEDMQKFVVEWRKFGGLAKKIKKEGKQLPIPATNNEESNTGSSSRSKNDSKKKEVKPTIKKKDHNQISTLLPSDIDEKNCNDKLLAIVHEAKKIALFDHTYAGLALVRILFEVAAVNFLIRHKLFDELKAYCATNREKKDTNGTTKTTGKKKNSDIFPSLEEIVIFLTNHPSIWKDKESYLSRSLSTFAKHKPKLNSIIHDPFHPESWPFAYRIRDEILPILRHLIEH